MRSTTLAALAASLVVAVASNAAASPEIIRIDWAVTPGQFAPLIPSVPQYGPNVYRHYGKSYVVDPIRLQGGGATLNALAAGETDVSTLSPQALVLGVVNAKLDIKVDRAADIDRGARISQQLLLGPHERGKDDRRPQGKGDCGAGAQFQYRFLAAHGAGARRADGAARLSARRDPVSRLIGGAGISQGGRRGPGPAVERDGGEKS
jgi:hypothetical protein